MQDRSLILIIYGVGRANVKVNENFQKKLIPHIKKHFSELKIIYIFNDIGNSNNPRTGEIFDDSSKNIDAFNSDQIVKTDSASLLKNIPDEFYSSLKDLHDDGYKTYKNLISQLAMLKIGANYIVDHDYCLAIRDDTLIKMGANFIKYVNFLDSTNFITSMWHWHYGYSDRLIFSKSSVAQILLSRYDEVYDFSRKYNFINGEILVKHICKKNKINPIPLDIKLIRERTHGPVNENFILPFWRFKELWSLMFYYLKFKIGVFNESLSFWRSPR